MNTTVPRGRSLQRLAALAIVALAGAGPTLPAAPPEQDPKPNREQIADSTPSLAEVIRVGVEALLQQQEGDDLAEWPYEGVYRVGGQIPIGYRIGGTAIGAMALLRAPGYVDDSRRQEAVRRAIGFICSAERHPFMAHDFESTYDVRGWGYAYGLLGLLQCKSADAVPTELQPDVERVIPFFLKGIEVTEIPETGGWNYARCAGFHAPGPPAPFMTAPTLQALFEAQQQGYAVAPALIERGLGALELARTPSGAFVYAGTNGPEGKAAIPGAVGRMVVGESTLFLAGRSAPDRVRGSIDAFLAHWQWLESRRAKSGTHARPYGIAPYYYYFAHLYAAQAIELLPEPDRPEYRRRLREILLQVRQDDGTWNDRVFPRSANYGTAMAVLALLMPEVPAPAAWVPKATVPDAGVPDLEVPEASGVEGR